jgi:hypothetical protein
MEDALVKVVISKYWHKPEITVYVDSQKIQVQIPIADFCKAMVAEIPHPSITMTRIQLEKQLMSVLDEVLNKVKKVTAEV